MRIVLKIIAKKETKSKNKQILFANGYRISIYFGIDTINDSIPNYFGLDSSYFTAPGTLGRNARNVRKVPDDQLTHGITYLIGLPITDNLHASLESSNLLFTELVVIEEAILSRQVKRDSFLLMRLNIRRCCDISLIMVLVY